MLSIVKHSWKSVIVAEVVDNIETLTNKIGDMKITKEKLKVRGTNT